ncbi:MAG: hypothetical protein JWO31_1819, partial [Phycisphaerales bacterium]|nr:hypothetical protein [Phycisphaerales bacterium]
ADGGTGGAMAMPRKLTAVLLAAGGMLVLSVGLCAVLVDPLNFGDHKAPHALPFPGSDPLTDDQAIDLAGRVLALDGRDAAQLALTRGGDREPAAVGREAGDGSVVVTYRHRRTGWWWYVVLRRGPGTVTGSSYHGT